MKYFSGMSYEEAVAKFDLFMSELMVQCLQIAALTMLEEIGEVSAEELKEAEEIHEVNHATAKAMAEELDKEVSIVNDTVFSLS